MLIFYRYVWPGVFLLTVSNKQNFICQMKYFLCISSEVKMRIPTAHVRNVKQMHIRWKKKPLKDPWLPYLIAQKHTLHSFTTLTLLEIFFFFLLELLIYMILNCWCLRSRLHKIYKNYFCLCCFTKQHTSQISVKFIWSHNVLSVYLLLEVFFFLN